VQPGARAPYREGWRAGAAGFLPPRRKGFRSCPTRGAPPGSPRRSRRGGSTRSAGAHSRSCLPLVERPDRGGFPISARPRSLLAVAIQVRRGAKTTRRCPRALATDDPFDSFLCFRCHARSTQAPGRAPATLLIRGAHVRPPQYSPSRCALQPLPPHPREAPRQGRRPALPPPRRRRPISARGPRPLDCIEPPTHHLRGAFPATLAWRSGAQGALPALGSWSHFLSERPFRATRERRSEAAATKRSQAPGQPALPRATPAALAAFLSRQRASLPSGPFARQRSCCPPLSRQRQALALSGPTRERGSTNQSGAPERSARSAAEQRGAPRRSAPSARRSRALRLPTASRAPFFDPPAEAAPFASTLHLAAAAADLRSSPAPALRHTPTDPKRRTPGHTPLPENRVRSQRCFALARKTAGRGLRPRSPLRLQRAAPRGPGTAAQRCPREAACPAAADGARRSAPGPRLP
jgi:hypothetical protein